MSPDRFDNLLTMVQPIIGKTDTRLRKSIPAAERLALTLRFLATGDSQQSLSFSFRIGKATVSKIISETCGAIYKVLQKKYGSPPETAAEWLKIRKSLKRLGICFT